MKSKKNNAKAAIKKLNAIMRLISIIFSAKANVSAASIHKKKMNQAGLKTF